MLTSLRSDIADNLDALTTLSDAHRRAATLMAGAETLRWVDEFEGVPSAEDIADAEELQERLDEISEIITNKKLTVAQLRKEIEAVLSR